MQKVTQGLYQFSTYMRPINLSFNQYMLDTADPLLVHTGNIQQAAALLPELKTQLKDKPLK